MNLQVKKEIWPVLIQVEPTRETFIKKIKTHERDIEPFQAGHYLSKQRQRAQYRSWRRWRRRIWEWLQCSQSQQPADTVVSSGWRRKRSGVVGSHFDFRQSRGAEVCWWWWPQWLDSMDRNIVLVLLCFSETFWRLLECQKAYVCVREKVGVQIWRLGHKENEKNKSCREKECVTSKAICIHGKYGSSWCLWEVEKSGSQG